MGGSAELEAALAVLDDPRAHLEAVAERAFLAALGASCVSPVGVFARLDAATLAMRALVFSVDGARHLIDEMSAEVVTARRPPRSARGWRSGCSRGGARELIGDAAPRPPPPKRARPRA